MPVEPKVGRYFRADPHDLTELAWPTDLKPATVRAALSQANTGDPEQQVELIDNALEADAKLRGVWMTRKKALTGLEWEIVPEPKVSKTVEGKAKETADYCAEIVSDIVGFDDFLDHNADAVGYSLSLSEIVWTFDGSSQKPTTIAPIYHKLVRSDAIDPRILRVITPRNRGQGEPIAAYPMKFIIHQPFPVGISPFRGGVLRAALVLHLIGRLGISWWASYVEMFGVPFRKGTYRAGASPDEITTLKNMLTDAGHAGWVLGPEGLTVDLIEAANRGTSPHAGLKAYIDECYAVLFLGQTLTTSIGDTGGAYSAAKVHNEVRLDVLRADAKSEAASIRNGLLKPLTILKYGYDAPVPQWRRKIPADTKAMLELMTGARKAGLNITRGWAHAKLEIPLPDGDDPNELLPEPQADTPFGAGPFGAASRHAAAKLPTVRRRDVSPVRLLRPWADTAVKKAQQQAKFILGRFTRRASRLKELGQVPFIALDVVDELEQERFAESIEPYLLACSLYGAYVAESELPKQSAARKKAPPMDFDLFAKPYEAAIKDLSERVDMPPDKFLELSAAARSRARRIAGQFNLRVLEDVYAKAEQTIREGGGVREFRLAVADVANEDGWAGKDPWHANLVFRQNARMAYGAGHLETMREAEVEAWTFSTYGTSCPICEDMDGLTFATEDIKWYPPLHFECDCYASPSFEKSEDVIRSDIVDNPAYDKSQQSAGAFRYDAAQYGNLEPLDIQAVAEPMRKVFRAVAAKYGWELVQ